MIERNLRKCKSDKEVNVPCNRGDATTLLRRPSLVSKALNLSSKYTGVSWNLQSKKWKATIFANGKQIFLGYFKSEIEAASKYDETAKLLGRPLNFPNADQPATAKKIRRGSSRYTGVHWVSARNKWKVQIKIDGKETYLGYFDDEQQAACKYDDFAASFGRPLNMYDKITDDRRRFRDTSIDKEKKYCFSRKQQRARAKVLILVRDFTTSCREVGRRRECSSMHTGVSWNTRRKKWVAQIKINGKNTYLGSHANEHDALCDYQQAAASPNKFIKLNQ